MDDPLATLRGRGGAFTMLALDQREGLRTMLAAASGSDDPVPDQALTAFKIEAARALTPDASAVLLDVGLGLAPVRAAGAIASGCAVIVAADRLVQQPGGPVEWTEVDEAVLADDAVGAAADAYKLLVIWRPGEEAEHGRVVRAFISGCRRRARPAIVEGIVRRADDSPPGRDEHAELAVAAARELAVFGADLYKAEVPTLGIGSDAAIRATSARLTAAIACPWVVLSNGTDPDRFPSACLAAVAGGASGFLAGRAIWSAALRAPDPAAFLRDVSAPRLAALARDVEAAVGASSGGRESRRMGVEQVD